MMNDFDKDKLIIRNANVEDAEGICKICNDALGYSCESLLIATRISELDYSNEAVFVAEYKNEIVGFVHVVNYKALYFENLANLLGLAVAKNYRRHGIASKLIRCVEHWAKDNNINMIRLNSGINRKGAHEFYRTLGFDNEKTQIRFLKSL